MDFQFEKITLKDTLNIFLFEIKSKGGVQRFLIVFYGEL